MIKARLVIRKTWRSEIGRVIIFIITCASAPILTHIFSGSILTGKLFSVGNQTLELSLPLYWLAALISLLDLIARIYNVRYVVDENGIEAWDGIISLRQTIVRVRHEDIRSIEMDQNILERFLYVGEVSVATAATGSVEITFQGIDDPQGLRKFLQEERDEVQKRRRAEHQQSLGSENASSRLSTGAAPTASDNVAGNQ